MYSKSSLRILVRHRSLCAEFRLDFSFQITINFAIIVTFLVLSLHTRRIHRGFVKGCVHLKGILFSKSLCLCDSMMPILPISGQICAICRGVYYCKVTFIMVLALLRMQPTGAYTQYL